MDVSCVGSARHRHAEVDFTGAGDGRDRVERRDPRRDRIGLAIDSSLEVRWTAAEQALGDGEFDGFEPVRNRLDHASSKRLDAFRQNWDAERAEGANLDALLDADALAEMSESERARALMTSSALLRHRPELIEELTPERIADMDTPTAVFAVSALTGTQDPEAMDQVGEIVGSLPADDVRRRRGMAVAAALGRPATPGSIDGLRRFLSSDSGKTASYGQLALGAQARDIAERDPDLANSVREQLYRSAREAEDVASLATLIRALGNAADPRLMDLAGTHGSHASPLIRGALAYALRFIEAPEATEFIRQKMLDDADRAVRKRALMATAFRDHGVFAAPLRTVVAEDAAADHRLLAVSRFAGAGLSAADRAVLRQAASKDPSPRVRARAEAVLRGEE